MADPQTHAVVRKVFWRLIPFCVLCYILNYLDRVNIAVAKLKLVGTPDFQGLPGFTADVFATGTAIFFLGYCLFELPSNLIQERVGPRRWIARIMISWGIISTCFMFIQGPWSFYILRFLLGFAEAGFFPGIILYLSYWIPHEYRARASAAFLTSTAISGVIGNLLGGSIQLLTENSPLGLQSWQWLFLLEGLPSILFGVIIFFYLTDKPSDARWLSSSERTHLTDLMNRERAEHPSSHLADLKHAFTSPHTWILSFLYGLVVFGFYMVNFFTTTILEKSIRASSLITPATGKPIIDLYVCLFSAIPFSAAAIGMVLIGRHSDRHNERKLHFAFACLLIAIGLGAAGMIPFLASGTLGTLLTITCLSIGAIGAFGTFGPFWSLPPQLLTGTAAAAAFAIINSIGNFFGGFLAPLCTTQTSMEISLFIAAGLAALAAIIALFAPIPRRPSNPAPAASPTIDCAAEAP